MIEYTFCRLESLEKGYVPCNEYDDGALRVKWVPASPGCPIGDKLPMLDETYVPKKRVQ